MFLPTELNQEYIRVGWGEIVHENEICVSSGDLVMCGPQLCKILEDVSL